MCSFSASPAPSPSQERPGYIASSVRSLGDYGRMVPEARRGHARPEAEVRRSTQSTHPGPHKSALTLLGRPRMEVIRGHNGAEPRLFRLFTPLEQLRRMELLEHRRVAYGARWFHVAPFGR